MNNSRPDETLLKTVDVQAMAADAGTLDTDALIAKYGEVIAKTVFNAVRTDANNEPFDPDADEDEDTAQRGPDFGMLS